MNTRPEDTITLTVLLALGSASCDQPLAAPETPMVTTVATAGIPDTYTVVAVGSDDPHRFQFEIALVDQGARELRSQILAQADRWARIVDGSDLENIEWEPGPVSCGRLSYDYQQDVLDDIFVMVSAQDYRSGAGVRSVTCGYRESSGLPITGTILLDVEGVPRGQVDDLILHAFGHMLGFGTSWRRLDLLRNSSSGHPGADTHFTGDRAIAAFVASGGAYYPGLRVPVENDPTYGSVDKHWRESVFASELMTSGLREGAADPLSAITIQSLADMGYTVDVEEADAYTLPAASAAASAMEAGHAIDLTEDVVITPAVFYDGQGRVVRVVRH
ncbi:MAG: hypothetical protein F4205_12510 [Gemmatimonadetes bacterium]|nr:hypothetical protein [Gemmatimonadota bacterium]MYG36306.1 hypothetical protein [Gemmatimonadota bacterium]